MNKSDLPAVTKLTAMLLLLFAAFVEKKCTKSLRCITRKKNNGMYFAKKQFTAKTTK